MADEDVTIPLFPSDSAFKTALSVFSNVKPRGSVNPDSITPTPLTSVLDGLVQGEKTAAALESVRSENAYRNAQLDEYGETADLRQAEIQARTAELASRTQLRQTEIDNMPAQLRLDTLKANVEANKLQLEDTKLKTENDKINKYNLDLAEARGAVTPSVEVDESVESRLARAEKSFSKVLRAGVRRPDKQLGDMSPKGIETDPEIEDGLLGLFEDAKTTSNPALISRARGLVNRYSQRVASVGSAASGGSDFNLIPAEVAPVQDELSFRLGVSPDPVGPAPQRAGISVTETIQAGAPNAPGGSVTESVTASAPAEPPVRDYQFPSADGSYQPELPVVDDEFNVDAADLPTAQKALRDAPFKSEEQLLGRAGQLAIQEGYKPGTKPFEDRQAEIKKSFTWSTQAENDVSKITAATGQMTDLAQKGNTLLKRMQDYEKKFPGFTASLALGKSQALARGEAVLGSNIAQYAGIADPAQIAAVDDVINTINGLGGVSVLNQVKEAGFDGQRTIDTDKEFERQVANLNTPTATLEQNISAIQGLIGRAQQMQNINQIIESGKKLGLSASATRSLIQQYKVSNPSTISGTINGKAYNVQNPNMTSGYGFMAKKQGLDNRLENGRVVTQPPATKDDINNIAGSVSKKPISSEEGVPDPSEMLLSSEGEYVLPKVRSADIPERHPDGASPALIQKVIQTESSGNPKATSSTGAKGLMQLTDGTGKALWKKFGWEGEYDPFDTKKNVQMGTKYLNEMLDIFNGDTNLALAAYNIGPKHIDDAVLKAEKYQNDRSWDVVKEYLPQDKTFKVNGKEVTINLQKQATDYVDKIMGTPEQLAQEKQEVAAENKETAVASLPPEYQTLANENLSEYQVKELNAVNGVTDPTEAQGTVIGDFANLLMAANPFAATEAQAQSITPTPEGGKPAPVTSPSKENTDTQNLIEDSALKGALGVLAPALKDPKVLGALALGASKSASLGLDDEAAIQLRQLVYGSSETPEQSAQFVRGIKDQMATKYPEWNFAGMVAGSVGGGLAGAALRGAKVLPVVGPVVSSVASKLGGAAAKVSAGAAAPVTKLASMARPGSTVNRLGSAAVGGAKGAAVGAGYGATFGFTEGEGGAVNRIKGAVKGAKSGAMFGAGLGATGGAVLPPKPANVSPKQAATIAASEQLEGVSVAEAKAVSSKLKAAPKDSNISLADEIQDGALSDTVGALSKEQGVAPAIKEKATPILNKAKERVISGISNITKRTVNPDTAVSNVAEKITKNFEKELKSREALANTTYEAAKDSLPKLPTGQAGGKPGDAKVLVFGPDGKPVLVMGNEAVEKGYVPKQVPGFQSPEVKDAVRYDPVVKQYITSTPAEVTKSGLMPDLSFNVIQNTLQRMRSDMRTATGDVKNSIKNSYNLLKEAAYNESGKFRSADIIFRRQSEKIDKLAENKVLKELATAYQEGGTKNKEAFVKKLFSYGKTELEALKKVIGVKGQQDLADMAQAHVENLVKGMGDRLPGATVKLPDITKNRTPEQLETLMGKRAAANVVKLFEDESKVLNTANKTVGGVKASKIGDDASAVNPYATKHIAEDAASTAALGGVGALTGNPYAMLGAARRGTGLVSEVISYFRKNPEVATKEIKQELAGMLYLDPQKGAQLLDDLIAASEGKLDYALGPIKNQYAKLVESFLIPGAAAIGEPDLTDKPSTARARRTKEVETIKKSLMDRNKISKPAKKIGRESYEAR